MLMPCVLLPYLIVADHRHKPGLSRNEVNANFDCGRWHRRMVLSSLKTPSDSISAMSTEADPAGKPQIGLFGYDTHRAHGNFEQDRKRASLRGQQYPIQGIRSLFLGQVSKCHIELDPVPYHPPINTLRPRHTAVRDHLVEFGCADTDVSGRLFAIEPAGWIGKGSQLASRVRAFKAADGNITFDIGSGWRRYL
jgi:hypothetical protein